MMQFPWLSRYAKSKMQIDLRETTAVECHSWKQDLSF